MSSSSITDPGFICDALSSHSVPQLLARPVKRVSFWAAIVLPFMHLSLLTAGLDSQSMLTAFIALVVLNVVALYFGHRHGQE
ncbi:MAG: hypothetical protein V5A52_05135 [Halovenus sp.]